MDAVQKANSGHPGMPMGMADAAYVLWTQFLKHNPADPAWPDRDRFVLSAGHGSMLLYSLLHLTGYDLPLEELQQFRQWGSRTPGHPEYGDTPGVETTTGPLGQGFANGVGMALAERMLAAAVQPPRLRDRRPLHLRHRQRRRPDGGHLPRGGLAGRAPGAGQADLPLRRQPHHHRGQHRPGLHRGRGRGASRPTAGTCSASTATTAPPSPRPSARPSAETERPSLIICRTHIGYGSPNKQDTAEAHGAPLGADEVRLTKEALGWPPDAQFYIPDEALTHFRTRSTARARRPGRVAERCSTRYAEAYPDLAAEWQRRLAGELPAGWEAALPAFTPADGALATRAAWGKVMEAIAPGAARAGRRLGRPAPLDQDLSESTMKPCERASSAAATCTLASASTPWAAS